MISAYQRTQCSTEPDQAVKSMPELTSFDRLLSNIHRVVTGWKSVLFSGFTKRPTEFSLSNFNLFNNWKEIKNCPIYDVQTTYAGTLEKRLSWTVFKDEQKRYYDPIRKQEKCTQLMGGTLLVHPISLLLSSMNKIFKIVTLAHFWHPGTANYSFKEKVVACLKDGILVAGMPVILLALEVAALYGALISPLDGAKVYAALEKLAFDEGLLAPCCQPLPSGKPRTNTWIQLISDQNGKCQFTHNTRKVYLLDQGK